MTVTTIDTTDRLLRRPPGVDGPVHVAAHLDLHGPLTIPKRDDRSWREGILRAVAESGLAGRGGAGFPSAIKWDAVRRGGRRPVLVVNAMEGEPASAKDRVLLGYTPHLVLDGAEVAAAVIGASEIVVCVSDHDTSTAAAVEAAIDERSRTGSSRRRYSLERPPGRYVAGEESALVNWLGTRQSLPVLRIDKSVPLTLNRRPTLVHNAETLSQVALIARHGPAWFRSAGTNDAPGTTLVTVTGAVRSPGVVEVELGTPILDILERTGTDSALAGVLIGGYGGAWLGPAQLATPYAPGPLRAVGATHGVGILVALPASSCGLAETARVVRYMAGESAGQCGPCVFGLPAIADDLELLWSGRADPAVFDRLARRCAEVDGRGACRHPDGVVRLVRTALDVFADDARGHANGHVCAAAGAATVMTFPRPPATVGRRS